jgi:ATP-dependent protease Clp ATPase subunit
MEGLLRKVMYEMPSIEGAKACLIDEKHVTQETDVTISRDEETDQRETG